MVDVDRMLFEGMFGDCIVDMGEVLVEKRVEEVGITAVLIDERDKKADSCVLDIAAVLLEGVDRCTVEGENPLKADEVGREEFVKLVGLRITEDKGDRVLSQVQIILVETVVTTMVLNAVNVATLAEISLLTRVSIMPTPSTTNALSSV